MSIPNIYSPFYEHTIFQSHSMAVYVTFWYVFSNSSKINVLIVFFSLILSRLPSYLYFVVSAKFNTSYNSYVTMDDIEDEPRDLHIYFNTFKGNVDFPYFSRLTPYNFIQIK